MASSKKNSTRKKTTTRSRSTSNNKKRATSAAVKELDAKQEAIRDEVILICIIAACLLLFISNLGIGGKVGFAVSSVMFGIFGILAYVFPVILAVGSAFILANKKNGFAVIKFVACFLLLMFLCMFSDLVTHGVDVLSAKDAYLDSYKTHLGGGFIGGGLSYYITPAFGLVGAFVIAIVIVIISMVIITEKSAINGMKRGGKHVYETAKENNERYQEYREQRLEEKAKRRMEKKAIGVAPDLTLEPMDNKLSDDVTELGFEDHLDMPQVTGQKITPLVSGQDIHPLFPPEPQNADKTIDSDYKEASFEIKGVFEADKTGDLNITDKENKEQTDSKPTKAEVAQETKQVAKQIALQEEVENYTLPPIELLKLPAGKKTGNKESDLRETAAKLERTLDTFGVKARVQNISCGPAVTRFELQPEMGVKVSKIVNLADDIKLNLAVADIRIEAPIPGKPMVGIEVPNKENVMVSFRELIESKEFEAAKSKVSFAVGKDISGKITVTDIAKMPHLLIAGATGSGKSVCINTIIMSILYKAKPDEVKLIMIDPKVVELSVYNGIPHLLIPVVTDPKKAAGALQWAVNEMTERYERFAEMGVRDIHGYNQKILGLTQTEGQDMPKKMSQIIVIVDELADLMMVASNEVEESICRLAQLARAAGIHLVIATQRPSVNVITGLIKANMPSRIAFAVTSGVDSRTILDMNGAEKLLGKGDMLFNPQGIPKPIRVQGAFVSDDEVTDVVSFIKEHNQSSYNSEVQSKVEALQSQSSSSNSVAIGGNDSMEEGRDPYFKEAAMILLDKEKASIGMLQRYLKVGFNRAARIMDQLEEAGVVGPEEGTKPRKILMSPEQFQQYVDEYL